jgi:hypothetical protein
MVDVDLNRGRLLREDNGHFKVFLGNRRTVYMIAIIEDTPNERSLHRRLWENNTRGEY